MEFANLLYKQGSHRRSPSTRCCCCWRRPRPHITAELWERRHPGEHVHAQPWPVADPALAAVDTVDDGRAGQRQGEGPHRGRRRHRARPRPRRSRWPPSRSSTPWTGPRPRRSSPGRPSSSTSSSDAGGDPPRGRVTDGRVGKGRRPRADPPSQRIERASRPAACAHLRGRRRARRRALRPAPRGGPRLRRQPPGPRRRGRATTSASSGPTTRQLVTAIQAVWLAGATVVVLPAADADGVDRGVRRPDPRRGSSTPTSSLVLVDPELAPFIEPVAGDPPMVGWEASSPAPAGRRGRLGPPRRRPRPPRHPAVHQRVDLRPEGRDAPAPHGRRRTSTPSPRRPRSTPTTTSWCRGCRCTTTWASSGCSSTGLTTGTPLVLGAPHDFTSSPGRWMEWISTYGGTATAGPNFSYVLAARALGAGRRARPVPPAHRAQRRRAGRPRHRRRASSRPARATGCAPARCSRRSAWPRSPSPAPSPSRCPGCAPTPSTGGCSRPSATPRPVDADHDGARHLAILGRPVQGLEIRDRRPRHRRRARRSARSGELEIRGTSVTPGYYKRPDANAELFHDGWLRTGDLAYLLDGEMVMCGRIKDVIIVGGRNVFPEDIERALADVDGVRAGNVIAFGVDLPGQGGRGRRGRVEVRRPTPCAAPWPPACATPSASRPRTSCWWSRAACPRPAPASSSARCARSATSAPSSSPSERRGRRRLADLVQLAASTAAQRARVARVRARRS